MVTDIETKRHSLSHVMAAAVKRLSPASALGIGPAIENGFYYDFLPENNEGFTSDFLAKVSEEMQRIIDGDVPFEKEELSPEAATKLFREAGEQFKLELIDELAREGHESVSIYRTGDFTDLCSGPHVASTAELRGISFSLDRVSGAYWRGSEKNPMLQRIYGLAFASAKDLRAFIAAREEAMKRDHRKIGQELDLFASSELVGRGLPMLLPKGETLRRTLERFTVDEELKRGYQYVQTPVLGRKALYEISGHWEHYKESMYPLLNIDGEEYVLRPMTCPHHFMIYKSRPRSYRDLPLRLAEISPQYRKEQSGELSGLIRVMAFHLADAHILCTQEQLRQEFLNVVDLVEYVMGSLGINDSISYRASLRDADDTQKYTDNPALWDTSEKLLLDILDEIGLKYSVARGEAAFYGPKLDVQMRNVLGKEDTIITIQIDFDLPQRFDLTYADADGENKTPVGIHRSSIGCLERTMAFLIEYYEGAFPCWLAPVQVRVLTVSDDQIEYASSVASRLLGEGIRCETDFRGDTIGKKIRSGRLQKIPYLVVIGNRECEAGTVTVRNRETGNQCDLSVDDFLMGLQKEISSRSKALAVGSSEEEK